ncbi:hypothetical protein B9Z55_007328 [Caenorhabditis nigoni]|uniref:Uncharacterized protein n=1 Tax=Caenorhabditis nigoni TaxID=1611254 RepID=A0A2G5V945_9PELO|nr:hypothetical protein B9Z55_007328 [Caenorhabditis nigoni]
MEHYIVTENDMEIAGEVAIGAEEEINELRLQVRDLRNAIAIARLQLREKDQEIQNLRAENEQLTVEKDTEVIFWFGAFNQEKDRADGLQLEKDQEIQNLRAENEQLAAEKNSEENFKYYWFGAFNREKIRADGLQLEKDQAGFGVHAVQVAAPSTPGPTTPTPSSLASGPASGPSSGSSGPSSGPASGPSSGPANGLSSGPASGPWFGPASGPCFGPASGSSSGSSGPSSGPASGLSSGPASGLSYGPASGPSSGPASRQSSNAPPTSPAPTSPVPTMPTPPPLAPGPASGPSGPSSSNAPPPRPVNSFHEALQCWNNWNGRDERVAGIDLKGYLFHPDNGRYVPQIVRQAPTNVRQLFFIKNRGRASLRVLNEQYKNEMNRTGLLRELQFIRNSQENQAAKGMVQIRD